MPARSDFQAGEFCWLDLSAHDLPSALAWYGELFGWEHMMQETPGGGPPYAFLMKSGAAVGGAGQMMEPMKAQGIPPVWNSYICTEDCAATEAKVRELGGTVTVPTMDVPGYGKLAFFMDPTGASFAAWQSTSSEGPGVLVKEHGGASWFELMTRDVEGAKAFYAALCGWDFVSVPMGEIEYTMCRKAGQDVGGMMAMDGPQFEGVPPHWMLYFEVDDCDAVAAKAGETGGAVRVPPTPIPVGKFAVLGDPQGGTFSVVQTGSQDC